MEIGGPPPVIKNHPLIEVIGSECRIADSVTIWRRDTLDPQNPRIQLKDGVVIFENVRLVLPSPTEYSDQKEFLSTGIRLGNKVTINVGSYISGEGGLDIDDEVLVGPGVCLLTGGHVIDEGVDEIYRNSLNHAPIHIGRGAWLGANCVVLPGKKIGPGAAIGAGSVVTKDVPPLAVVVGNPARIIRYRNNASQEDPIQSSSILDSFDHKTFERIGQRLNTQFGLTFFNESLSERDEKISALDQAVHQQNGQITELKKIVSDRDNQIIAFNKHWMERDKQIAELNQAFVERDQHIFILNKLLADKDEKATELTQAVLKRERQNATLNHTVDKLTQKQINHQCHVAELEKAVEATNQASEAVKLEVVYSKQLITNLQDEIQLIKQSHSWRFTAPLRKMATLKRQAPQYLMGLTVKVCRKLPFSPTFRQKLKNVVFSLFGFACHRMPAYQNWKSYQRILNMPVLTEASAPPLTPSLFTMSGVPTLPSADGSWEWSDYYVVKSRIAQINLIRQHEVAPRPPKMVSISDKSYTSVVAKIKLPPLVSEPDVSIILPVFNNIKYTLECLLSISNNSGTSVSYEILLADDASSDETALIIPSIPNIRYLRNPINLGFLRNCNNALTQVKGRYVLFLNNDVQVTTGWLETLLYTFKTYPKVGAVGPQFIYPSGHLQEAGSALRPDGTAIMVGLNDEPNRKQYSYIRRVDYASGACLMLPTSLVKQLGGFSEEYLPCYCEDSDLCLRVQDAGYFVYYNPVARVIHHLSKTTNNLDKTFKMKCITKNLVTLRNKWQDALDRSSAPKVIAFYLPQFHPFPENDKWWGRGFTEWTNVTKAQANFVGHYQPRLPADLGFYDLRLPEVLKQQTELARRYGIQGFCFYYYWFAGKRLLEQPIEQMLASQEPDFPFCLCWANENWTRRWDGQEHEVLMAQSHSEEDDKAVIMDLIRFFKDKRYIRVDGRPLIMVYRVSLFPDFLETASRWRSVCREEGLGEIYIASVETFDLVGTNKSPQQFGCDAAVEFPPQGLAEPKEPTGKILNKQFSGRAADYRDLAVRYATRELPGYTRFQGVVPGWDNTARRQNNGFCFEHATPGAFQAWLEEVIEQTRNQHYGDEKLVFINAWNEWAEGAYLEPDLRFGHTYLEAVKNAIESEWLMRRNKYGMGN